MAQARELALRLQRLLGPASATPRVYRAPGRVNLMGGHTDYNGGFVLPAALDMVTWLAARPRDDRLLRIHSTNFSQTVELDLDRPHPLPNHWNLYPAGVAMLLERSGLRLRGADLLFRGEIPIGCGLGSSAAVEVATGFALLDLADLPVDLVTLAKTCQRAENVIVGTRCGVMDAFTSCCGEDGSALLLDCRSLEYTPLPLPESASLVICNTGVRHELATSEYQERRQDCGTAVFLLSEQGVRPLRTLRDVPLDRLKALQDSLPELIYQRAHHVVSENDRVHRGAGALEQGDLERFGQLMVESHRSLRDDYEVSCVELDLAVELAMNQPGVYGARMTGGGFGGCTINLVDRAHVDGFRHSLKKAYTQKMGHPGDVYVCRPSVGVTRVED